MSEPETVMGAMGTGVQVSGQQQQQQADDTPSGLWPEYCNPSYQMPEEIEVKVTLASGDYYFPVVVVKAEPSSKSYLGGYRNKMTGRVYHHAATMTPTEQKKSSKDVSRLRSRDTQTYEERTLSVQSYRESGTQMERMELKLDSRGDRECIARPYFTSDELLNKKRLSTVFIQRCWRGYTARCLSIRLREGNIRFAQQQKEERELMILAQKERQEMDMKRRLAPKTNKDFSILFNELDTWRKEEIAKIKANTKAGEERNLAMAALLNDETKALQSIQKLKVVAHKSIHSEKTSQMLELMSKPHKWQLSSGDVALVQTPATQRAKELLDLYGALNAPLLSTDERLDVLLHVKWTVLEFDTPLTKDIADLTDREADLLNRGRSLKSMEKLRTRLCNLFLEFLESPTYNPRASEFVGKLNA